MRKASHGNVYAFTHAASSYFDLLSEYFYLIGYEDPRERMFEMQKLLSDCWRYLPYTRRVSDFERFLQLQLEKRKPRGEPSMAPEHEALRGLDHVQRFLLVAREFEEWSYKNLALSLRFKQRDIAKDLMELKAKLIGFKIGMLRQQQQSRVFLLSEMLEGELPAKSARRLQREIASEYHVLQFKADWLEYRCELIDLRQELRLSTQQTNELKNRFNESLKLQPMEQPKFSDNVVNQFTFKRIPS